MGAWATDVFGNDTGLDFLGELINESAVKKVMKQSTKNGFHCYDEIRVAAAVLLHLHKINGLWFEQKTIGGMIDVLDAASKDKEWIGSWCDPKDGEEVRKQVKSLARKLRNLEGY